MPLLACAAIAGCDGAGIPASSSDHSAVPAQAVNGESLGVIRIRFDRTRGSADRSNYQVLKSWMSNNGLECPRVDYLLEQLAKGGFDTFLAVIPGNDAFLDDAGVYVGGPLERSAEDLEDILIKVGGFSLGGLAASKLQVRSIGNGWYYIGINGDGVIDGASSWAAARMSEALDAVGDRAVCGIVPIEGLDETIDDIAPGDQSRIVRRIRAVAQALDDAIALAVSVTSDARTEVIIAFPSEAHAAALDSAFARIRKDMELALEGSIEQGDVTAEEAERDRKLIAALRTVHRGRSVVLYEELPEPTR